MDHHKYKQHKFYLLILRERERLKEGRGKERGGESQAGSSLTEPNTRLDPTTGEIMT